MMLLYFYLGTCAFSVISLVCLLLDCIVWAKANNIKTKKDSSIFSATIKMIIMCSIPLFNVIIGYLSLFNYTFRQAIMKEIEKNKIN